MSLSVIDLYPLNGVIESSKFDITKYARTKHFNQMVEHAKLVDKIEGIRCLVIDFQDKYTCYNNLEKISFVELSFAEFFRKSSGKTIYYLFKRCNIDFIINEGTLKASLIKSALTPEQSTYFQGSKAGSDLFCQICEVVMNGFKQGCEVEVNGISFHPDHYISFIGERKKWTSTHLITFYPATYKDTYSEKSLYYQLITNLFKTTHRVENGTTIITINTSPLS
jgi:hypothetical protein